MFIILPLLSLILLFLILHKRNDDWRNSALSVAIVWGVFLTIITEILSLFKLLTLGWILGVWGLTCVILALICFGTLKNRKQIARVDTLTKIYKAAKIPLFLILLLCGLAFIVAVVGLTALMAPPNNWDSMDYHMARVAHWIQNHSVTHYPTSFLPQLYQSPWSEFTIMHFQILSGGDYFANLVQWLSMVGSILGVSLIAKQLGADLRGQIFSAVVTATLPMGILQGSSTQNDYVVSFWIVCFVYYVLLTMKERISLVHSFKIGTSLGLAILTKATAYIYAFPFFVLFFFAAIKRLRWKLWKPILTVALLVFVINIGHYARNFDLFGTPIAVGEEKYTNYVFTAPIFLSNVIKNLSLHIGTIGLINSLIIQGLQLLHMILGVDINDTRTTWGEFRIRVLSNHEDSAGNLVHLLVILLIIAIFLKQKNLRRRKYIVSYFVPVVGMFLLFCFLLRWQAFNSRLHLPIFVLFSAFVGLVLSNLSNYKLANCVAIILILSALPWSLFNSSRPLLFSMDRQKYVENGQIVFSSQNLWNTSRIEQYFNNRPDLKKPYMGAVDFVMNKKCSNVGLSLDLANWEYPFWVLLQKNGNQFARIEHVNLKNISSRISNMYHYKKFNPCAIIFVSPNKGKVRQQEEIITQKGNYVKEWSLAPVSVFVKR
jgi:4-amino-4-deoxy-L-arabinose transferase-like glycosyltransferase